MRSYMHTCHFMWVEQLYFFVSIAKIAFVLDYTSKFLIPFCRFSKKREACAPSICVW